jgi:hypothetical protein
MAYSICYGAGVLVATALDPECLSVVIALHPEYLSSSTVESRGHSSFVAKSSAEPWGISRLLIGLLLLADISFLVRELWNK